jgi:hypothetical protein
VGVLKDIQARLDSVISSVWEKDILYDYKNHFLLMEDTLKNAFYHHLRTNLGDGFLKRHRIRIFTEYNIGKAVADIAIVSLRPKVAFEEGEHLKERVDQVLAVIELKYKAGECGIGPFQDDIAKSASIRRVWQLQDYEVLFRLYL